MTMNKHNGRTLAAALLALAGAGTAPSVSAAEVGLGLHGGTLGLGLDLDFDMTRHVGVRAGFNRFNNSEEWEEDDLDYEADVDFESVYGLLDWHPFGGTFRFTAGAMGTDHIISGAADVETGDEVGDGTAQEDGRLEAEVAFDDVAPYLGVGWDWRFDSTNLALGLDVGVLSQGDPDVELRETDDVGVNQQDLDEAEREIEAEWSDFDTYPVIQVGLTYRF